MPSTFTIQYDKFENISALTPPLANLAQEAIKAYAFSYAPYSRFQVGAAILLENDSIVLGANQENASYSMTICAERTALGNYSMQQPNVPISCIAITYTSDPITDINALLSPCGACRQHILEYQNKQTKPIQILLIAPSGKCLLIHQIHDLLPFAFTGQELPL